MLRKSEELKLLKKKKNKSLNKNNIPIIFINQSTLRIKIYKICLHMCKYYIYSCVFISIPKKNNLNKN